MIKPPGCTGCPGHSNLGFANGEGPDHAPIVFVGEALGDTERVEGKPFVGGTGRMLRMMLWQAGLTSSQYYLTNLVKCQPPLKRDPTKDEISYCSSTYLAHELARIKPRVVVPVGDTALFHILPGAPASSSYVRGHIFDGGGTKVIPIVHPQFIVRGNPEYWAITVNDLDRIKEAAKTPDMPPRRERFNLNPSLFEVQHVVDEIIKGNLPFAFDIETIGERDQINILCIGIAWSPIDAMCIPFLRRGGYEYWKNPWEELKAWEAVCKLFSSNCTKITQNGFTFDVPVLMDLGVKFKRHTVVDTLIKHHVVATELPHSLAFLTSVYTDLPYYKGDVRAHGGMLWAPDEILRRYNCLDCIATYITNFHLDKEMEELKIYVKS